MTTTKTLAFDAREFIMVVKCIMKLPPNETKRNGTKPEQNRAHKTTPEQTRPDLATPDKATPDHARPN